MQLQERAGDAGRGRPGPPAGASHVIDVFGAEAGLGQPGRPRRSPGHRSRRAQRDRERMAGRELAFAGMFICPHPVRWVLAASRCGELLRTVIFAFAVLGSQPCWQ